MKEGNKDRTPQFDPTSTYIYSNSTLKDLECVSRVVLYYIKILFLLTLYFQTEL